MKKIAVRRLLSHLDRKWWRLAKDGRGKIEKYRKPILLCIKLVVLGYRLNINGD